MTTPDMSSPDMTTPGTAALPPTMIDVDSLGGGTAIAVSASVGTGVVLVVPDGQEADWTASISDPALGRFVAGGDMGGWIARPGIEVLGVGQFDVTVTGPSGTVGTFTVTAVDPAEPPMIADPSTDPEVTEAAAASVGMMEAEATAAIEAAGGSVRVVSRDGEDFPVTMDYRFDRVNLSIVEGIVTEASIG